MKKCFAKCSFSRSKFYNVAVKKGPRWPAAKVSLSFITMDEMKLNKSRSRLVLEEIDLYKPETALSDFGSIWGFTIGISFISLLHPLLKKKSTK